jgi:hypothetical protein
VPPSYNKNRVDVSGCVSPTANTWRNGSKKTREGNGVGITRNSTASSNSDPSNGNARTHKANNETIAIKSRQAREFDIGNSWKDPRITRIYANGK